MNQKFSNEVKVSASQEKLNEQYQEQLVGCLQQIEAQMQMIDQVNNESTNMASTQNNIKMRLTEIHEQLVGIQEVFADVQLVTDLNEIIAQIDQFFAVTESLYLIELHLMGSDDIFTWKVDSLLLLGDNLPTLYSDAFQSSRWGYRMRIGIAIKKDEQTQIRCVLVSFIIMRGEYDPILCWPFPYPITCCLVDLAGAKKHIVKSIQPDSQTAIFGKPSSDMNKPYYLVEFCPLDSLIDAQSRFIRDQSMFLRCHIDFTKLGIHPF